LICCKTIIAKGAPTKAGTHESHGAPLGDKEIAAARTQLGWSYAPFVVPPDVYAAWDAREAGAFAQDSWKAMLANYSRAYPAEARELGRRLSGQLPADFGARVQDLLTQVRKQSQSIATRKASQDVIEALAPTLPELLGGSADLAGSNLTLWSGSRSIAGNESGNYVHYGVREFGMAAIMNGVALHGGFIPYGGTFLTFSDYSRNALRMAALMRIRSIFVFTHDSIGLGEDGPTHQPVEHVASLRLIPNMDLWRPCDTEETAVAWAAAIARRDGPTCLIFSRQNLPFQKRSAGTAADIARGGYVLVEPGSAPRAVIIATGSEIGLAVEAQQTLATTGIAVRVVSMVCTSVFDRQPLDYQRSVLPPELPCVAVEAGSPDLWRKYVGRKGEVIGMSTFGESAPAGELFKHFGFTAGHVAEAVRHVLGQAGTDGVGRFVPIAAS
jgi:transketolase